MFAIQTAPGRIWPRAAALALALASVVTALAMSAPADAHTTQADATASNAGAGPHPWPSDGCTASEDRRPGLFDFKHACVHHDGCYAGYPRSGGARRQRVTRLRCDTRFRTDMRASCRAQHSPRAGKRQACLDVAERYYKGVRRFGAPYYKKA